MADTKKKIIVDTVLKILATYKNIQLTLRQLHYRLVEAAKTMTNLTYPNTQSQYKKLSEILVEARMDGVIPMDIFEDKDRTIYPVDSPFYYPPKYVIDVETNVEELIKDKIQEYERNASSWYIPKWLLQEDVVLVMLEKKALENLFIPETNNKAHFLACKGYNSLTQLNELAKALKKEKRKIHLKTFSDFDPSGLDIQRNFIEQAQALGVKFETIERMALTDKQVADYGLPFAPTKTTDSRAKDWEAAGVVELDALDPRVLQDLVKGAIAKHFDKAIEKELAGLQKVIRRNLIKQMALKIQAIKDQINKGGDP